MSDAEKDIVERPELRMDAYYYDFCFTCSDEINLILSAVACAGKAFHNTCDWNDDNEWGPPHSGATPVEWIQNAATRAADTITTLRAEVERLTEERETIFMDIVDERDAAIARAEKAEAALAKMRDHYDNVDMSHEAFRVMASVEADKVLGGRYEAEAVAFVESLTQGE